MLDSTVVEGNCGGSSAGSRRMRDVKLNVFFFDNENSLSRRSIILSRY
jgi:hypothetical protein